MGATGYRDFKQLLVKLGSVSEYVVQHASCPVLVIRAG
jgi:nucleotide-binding universal stress UspA family protein